MKPVKAVMRRLVTPAQHHEIRAWISTARTPDAIIQMPESPWRSLELASVLMGLDAESLAAAELRRAGMTP